MKPRGGSDDTARGGPTGDEADGQGRTPAGGGPARRAAAEGLRVTVDPGAADRRAASRRAARRRGALVTLGLAALPLIYLGYLFVYPLVSVLAVSLVEDGRLDLEPFLDILRRPNLRGVIWFTFWQAAVSTGLTLLVGLPGAYLFARYDFPGKSLLRAAVTIPFVLPAVVVGSAYLALLGPGGPLGVDLRNSLAAILIAHVFYNYAIVTRTVGGLWAHLDPRLEDAARMLGAGRWRTFREITLPLLRPAIAAATSLVFLFTFTSFGIILILGGLHYATIEVEIYRQTTAYLDLALAAALAVVQMVLVMAILFAYSRYQERRSLELSLRPAGETARRPRNRREWAFVGGTLLSAGLYLGAPLLVLVSRSFHTPQGYSLAHYQALAGPESTALFVPPVEAVRNSLVFAVVATLLALTVGMMAAAVIAYRRGWAARSIDLMLMLPLGTSAVTIGLGFIVALDWPFDLRTSAILIPLAHSLVAIPFVVRTAVPVMRSVKGRLREAAAVLGASPSRARREVDLPLVGRSALVGAAFAFAISLGEFGATTLIARPDTPTIPIAIFRLLQRPGALNVGQAMALSTILMVITAVSIALIERFRVGDVGEF